MSASPLKWKPPPRGAIILQELPRDAQGRRIYTCSLCDRKSHGWNKGWTWFGSYANLDDGWVRKTLCKKCSPSYEDEKASRFA